MDIEILNDWLKVRISTLGAEIQSVIDANGTERMWQGDPAFWTGRAPVLFPFAGALKDGYYLYGGKKYELPQHGFARRSEFQVEEQSTSGVTFLLDTPNENYPFEYAFRVRYTLKGQSIRVDYIAENRGESDMYYAAGAHEAYSIPEGLHHYRLVFDEEESLRHSILEGAQITTSFQQITEHTRNLPLHSGLFANDSLVFLHVNSRGVTLECDQKAERVRVDFDGFDTLLIWQKPRSTFICIEPWMNPPEYTTSDHRLMHKPGMSCLAPGKSEMHTHTITFI